MIYNYHAHTYRCGHATGSEEEYVLRAMEGGIKYMGFSEHFPFRFPDGHESRYRLPVCEVEAYRAEVERLKKKYADKIEIKLGFEMEYYPEYFESMVESARAYGAEYLICGPHCLSAEHEYPRHVYTIYPTVNSDDMRAYASMITGAIATGVFTYVAHPDITGFMGDAEVFLEEMRGICLASREYGVPLELNFLGIREKRNYPNELFWRIAGEIGAPVTFGFDAHSVAAAYDAESLKTASALVEKYRLNYIGRPTLKPLK